jgi:hypothetical protein
MRQRSALAVIMIAGSFLAGCNSPLAAGPVSAGYPDVMVIPITPGRRHFFTDGMEVLENRGGATAIVDAVTMEAATSPGVKLGAVYVAGQDRIRGSAAGAGAGGVDQWPPFWLRAGVLRAAVSGTRVPVKSAAAWAGVEIVTRVDYPARRGTYVMTGYVVRYHVGDTGYVLHIKHRLVGCVDQNPNAPCGGN